MGVIISAGYLNIGEGYIVCIFKTTQRDQMGNCTCANVSDTTAELTELSETDSEIMSELDEIIALEDEIFVETMEERRIVDRAAALEILKQRVMLIELRAIARLGCDNSKDVDWDELEADVILLGRLCVELYML